jgi:hypothetical protein
VAGVTWALALEPLPPAIYARAAKENALGLSNRTEPLVVAVLSPSWQNAADDDLVASTAESLMSAIDDEARNLGAFDPFIYLNYAGEFQDAIASYGPASVQQLQQVKNRVDPRGVFTYQVPGGYKVPSQ